MTPASTDPRLVLASASPRRRELLAQLGIDCRVLPADVDERPRPGEVPDDYVVRVALEKGRAAMAMLVPAAPVLAADTAVVLDGRILGKPLDEADAARMLTALSGRTHEVLSAVALLQSGGEEHVRLNRSSVRFRPIEAAEIAAYWRTGEPIDKAGGYGVQGLGAIFVAHLEGSYSAVMGLPLFETGAMLVAAGWSLSTRGLVAGA